MKKSGICLLLGILPLISFHTHAKGPDTDAGKAAFQTCRGCHSLPGYSNAYPTFYVPKLGGQNSEYIVNALTAYKEQTRPHGTMKANSYDLTEEKMRNIAAFISTSNNSPSAAPADGDATAGKKLAETCISCHADKPNPESNIPRLSGQYGNYLVKAMKEYQSGKRKNPVMQSMVKDLSKTQLQDIAAYFAEKKGLSTVE